MYKVELNMKSVISVCALVFVAQQVTAIRFMRLLPPKIETEEEIPPKYFRQIVDHNSGNHTYWNQKYFVNDDYWKGGDSPLFLFIGGESEANPVWMQIGAWVDWGMKYGARLFQLEHRFYGQSRPTSDASVENLRLLTSKQALHDLAYFIEQMNQHYNLTSSNKWILFGGSYAGNLAAWARLKYPDQVFGSVSSSGPLNAKVNFNEFYEVVRKSLNYYSPGCANEVTKTMKSIQKMLESEQGLSTLHQKLPPCFGFNPKNKYEVALYFEGLIYIISNAVQYNNQLETNSIDLVCKFMNNRKVADPVDRFMQLRENQSQTDCYDTSFQNEVMYLRQTEWNSSPVLSGNRQWIYQMCNEFGYIVTSESKRSFLSNSVPVDYFTQLCTEVFGSGFNAVQLNRAVQETNNYYEGTNIKVKRVVFLQGSIDPWYALGIVKHPTKEDPFVLIKGTSHCYDMLPPQDSDSKSLRRARKIVDRYIKKWLSM